MIDVIRRTWLPLLIWGLGCGVHVLTVWKGLVSPVGNIIFGAFAWYIVAYLLWRLGRHQREADAAWLGLTAQDIANADQLASAIRRRLDLEDKSPATSA